MARQCLTQLSYKTRWETNLNYVWTQKAGSATARPSPETSPRAGAGRGCPGASPGPRAALPFPSETLTHLPAPRPTQHASL